MIFLFATPMLSGFGNYFVPLQIGSRDMAFPRLNALGYWIFLGAGLFMYSGLVLGKAPNAGWFNYVPLSAEQFDSGPNIDFYGAGADLPRDLDDGRRDQLHRHDREAPRARDVDQPDPALLLGGARDVARDRVRDPRTHRRVGPARARPRCSASASSTCRHGGDPVLWQHLFWIFGHPDVYIIFLPAVGIVSTIVPTFARRPMVALHVDGARDDDDRVPRLRRLGAPHVRRGAAAADDHVLRRGEPADRGPERRAGVRLARDARRRPPRAEDAAPLRARLLRRVRRSAA